MRSCPQCGAPVGDTDTFCGDCGNYLGWQSGAGAGPEGGPAAGSGPVPGSAPAPGPGPRPGPAPAPGPALASAPRPAPEPGPAPAPAPARAVEAAAPARPDPDQPGRVQPSATHRDTLPRGPAPDLDPLGRVVPSGTDLEPAPGGSTPEVDPLGRVVPSGTDLEPAPGGPAPDLDPLGRVVPSGTDLEPAPGGPTPEVDPFGRVVPSGTHAGPAPGGPVPELDPLGPVVPSGTRPGPAPGGREPDIDPLGPVLPGRPEARRPLPTAAAETVVEGPPCPVCGTANPPGRRFCRNCGALVDPAARPAAGSRQRWWRRWRWRGDSSRWLRRLVALAVIAVLALTGILFRSHLINLVDYLRDRAAKPVAVAPSRTVASAQVPGHPATAAVDGLSNRYWGAPHVGDSIEFTFPYPFRLLSVVVHTGESPRREDYIREARPSVLDMVVISEDGSTRTIPVILIDKPGPQRTDTGVSHVVRIRLVIRDAAGLATGRHIALGEVEFFRR